MVRFFKNHIASVPSNNQNNSKYRSMDCRNIIGDWEDQSNSSIYKEIHVGGGRNK